MAYYCEACGETHSDGDGAWCAASHLREVAAARAEAVEEERRAWDERMRRHREEEARVRAILDWGAYATSVVHHQIWSAEMVDRDLEWWGPGRPSIKALSKRWGWSYDHARDVVREHEGRGA